VGASRMRAPTVSVDQALPVVGSYFIPAPRSMEAADARIWGASRLAVASPAPIANREFMAGGSADGVSPPHRLMLMLTSRLSRVHSLQHNEEYKLRPVQGDRLLQSIQPLRLQKGAVCSEVLFQIALNGGLRSPMLRSDQCWVGGDSPLDSALALPDTSKIQDQLEDFFTFLSTHQANTSREVAEAAAYQLLTIHPLADGNGRAVRALLVSMAARTKSAYPLYFAWRLMFDKRRTATAWECSAQTGRGTQSTSHYDQWRSCAAALVATYRRLVDEGLDSRIADALILHGYADEATVLSSAPACTNALARKMLERASSSRDARLVEDLTIELKERVNMLRSAVTA